MTKKQWILGGIALLSIGTLTACGTVNQTSQNHKSQSSTQTSSKTSVNHQHETNYKQPPNVDSQKKGLYGNLLEPVKMSWFQQLTTQDSFIDSKGKSVKLSANKNIVFFAFWDKSSQIMIKEIVKHHRSDQYEFVSTFWNFVPNPTNGHIAKSLSFPKAVSSTKNELSKLGVKHPSMIFTVPNHDQNIFGVPTLLMQENHQWFVMNGAPSGDTALWNEVF